MDDAVPERGEAGNGFAALNSGDAELDKAIMSATTLQLFPTDDPEPAKASASAMPAAGPEDREPERESAFATRERLRGERSRLTPT